MKTEEAGPHALCFPRNYKVAAGLSISIMEVRQTLLRLSNSNNYRNSSNSKMDRARIVSVIDVQQHLSTAQSLSDHRAHVLDCRRKFVVIAE